MRVSAASTMRFSTRYPRILHCENSKGPQRLSCSPSAFGSLASSGQQLGVSITCGLSRVVYHVWHAVHVVARRVRPRGIACRFFSSGHAIACSAELASICNSHSSPSPPIFLAEAVPSCRGRRRDRKAPSSVGWCTSAADGGRVEGGGTASRCFGRPPCTTLLRILRNQ